MGITLPIKNTSAGECPEAYCRLKEIQAITFEHSKVKVKLFGYKDKAMADAKKAAWEADQANAENSSDEEEGEEYEKQYHGAGCIACPTFEVELTQKERDHMMSLIYQAIKRESSAKGNGEKLDFTKAKDVIEEDQSVAKL